MDHNQSLVLDLRIVECRLLLFFQYTSILKSRYRILKLSYEHSHRSPEFPNPNFLSYETEITTLYIKITVFVFVPID